MLFSFYEAQAQPCQIIDEGLVSTFCNGNDIVGFTINPFTSGSTSATYNISSTQGFHSTTVGTYGQNTTSLFQFSGTPSPNAFSPNGDGRNDYFTLFADNGQIVSIRRLSIFDRWGNQVFLREDLSPNVEMQGWDGRYKGELMGPAVFVFVAEVELVDGRVILERGGLTLLR